MSEEEEKASPLLLIIAFAVILVGSGIIAWNIVGPHSFWSVILFLVVWAVVGFGLQVLIALVVKIWYR